MKLLKRSMITAAALGGLLTAGATPASAIIGGHDVGQRYPGMAALSAFYPGLGTAQCGAALIHPRFLLTAAHCVSDQQAAPAPVAAPGGNVTARIGSTDRTGGVLATGKQVYLHPDWMWGMPGKPVSDLALVELTKAVPLRLMPISGRQVGEADRARLIGWGLTEFPPPAEATLPVTLQQRDTTRLPSTACAGGFIGTGETCLGSGACFGDSGGPALRSADGDRHRNRRWASVGIASRETSKKDPCDNPSVFTDPTHPPYRAWIYTTIVKPAIPPRTRPPVDTLTSTDVVRMSLLRPLIVP